MHVRSHTSSIKLIKLITLSALAVSLLCSNSLQAAEKGERGKGKRPEGAQKGQKGQRGGGMAKLLQDIGVSKETMQAIQKDLQALRDVPPEERREKYQAVFKKHLTEEQLKEFEKKRREAMGAQGKGKGKGKGRPEKN